MLCTNLFDEVFVEHGSHKAIISKRSYQYIREEHDGIPNEQVPGVILWLFSVAQDWNCACVQIESDVEDGGEWRKVRCVKHDGPNSMQLLPRSRFVLKCCPDPVSCL